jgi:hypothetical protein
MFPQPSTDGQTVKARKGDVKDDGVIVRDRREVECLLAVTGNIDGIRLIAEAASNGLRCARLVLDQQETHRVILVAAAIVFQGRAQCSSAGRGRHRRQLDLCRGNVETTYAVNRFRGRPPLAPLILKCFTASSSTPSRAACSATLSAIGSTPRRSHDN